jgi:hypothetical protein
MLPTSVCRNYSVYAHLAASDLPFPRRIHTTRRGNRISSPRPPRVPPSTGHLAALFSFTKYNQNREAPERCCRGKAPSRNMLAEHGGFRGSRSRRRGSPDRQPCIWWIWHAVSLIQACFVEGICGGLNGCRQRRSAITPVFGRSSPLISESDHSNIDGRTLERHDTHIKWTHKIKSPHRVMSTCERCRSQ